MEKIQRHRRGKEFYVLLRDSIRKSYKIFTQQQQDLIRALFDNINAEIKHSDRSLIRAQAFQSFFQNWTFPKVPVKLDVGLPSAYENGVPVSLNLNVPESVENLMSCLTNYIKGFQSLLGVGISTGKIFRSLILTLVSLYRSDNLVDKGIAISQFLNNFDFTDSLDVKEFALTLAKVIQRLQSGNIQAQACQEDTVPENLLVVMIKFITTIFDKKTKIEVNADDIRVKRIRQLWFMVQSMTGLYNFLEKAFELAKEYAITLMTGVPLAHTQIETLYPNFIDWFERVDQIYEDCGLIKVRRSDELAQEVSALWKKGNDMLSSFSLMKMPTNLVRVFMVKYNQCKELFDESRSLIYYDKPRVPPFMLYLFGASGVGKSTIVSLISDSMAHMSGLQGHNHMYMRVSGGKYWDNYTNQFCCVIDDAYQSCAIEDCIAESMAIIRCTNNMPYPLDMAHLVDKGNVRFDSKLLIVTSNSQNPVESGVQHVEAVLRRRDLVVEVKLKDEYKRVEIIDGKEFIKVNRKFEHLETKIYHFDLYDSMGSYIIMHDLEWEELLSVLWYNFKNKMEREALILKDIEYLVDQGCEKLRAEDDRKMICKVKAQSLISDMMETYVKEPEYKDCLAIDIQAPGDHKLEFSESDTTLFETMLSHKMEPDILSCPLQIKRFNEYKRSKGVKNKSYWVETWTNMIKEWVKTIVDEIKNNALLQSLLKFGALATALFGAYKMFKAMMGGSAQEETIPIKKKNMVRLTEAVSGDEKTMRIVKKMHVGRKYLDKNTNRAEASVDNNAMTLCHNVLLYHVFRSTIVVNGRGTTSHGLFIGDRVAIVPLHDLAVLNGEEDSTISIFTCGPTYLNIPTKSIDVIEYPEMDVAFLKFDSTVKQFKNIIHHFIKEVDLGRHNFSHLRILTTMMTQSKQLIFKEEDYTDVETYGTLDYIDGTDEFIEVKDSFLYKGSTYPGLCGSPLVLMNKYCMRKIVGFHIAGSEGKGYSNILTSEIVSEYFNMFFEEKIPIEIEEPQVSGDIKAQGYILDNDVVEFCGMMDEKHGVYQPSNTKIRPSALQGDWTPIVTQPAMLHRTGDIDPYRNGLTKYFGAVIALDQSILDTIVQGMIVEINSLKSQHKHVLTDFQALNGIIDDEYIRPMKMNTSAGYPYVLNKGKEKGKRSFVDIIDGDIFPGDILRKEWDDREIKAVQGVVKETIWIDNLKDERRPIEKVAQGKTRLFVSAPFDFSVMFRKYFLSFCAHIMRNRDGLESAVGINPHCKDWDLMYKNLMRVDVDHTFIVGDYSCYDGTIPAQVIDCVRRIADAWYDDEFSLQREVLFSSIMYPYHIVGRSVYRVVRGNPSGNPLTTVLNSLVNTILMRYAWTQLAKNYNMGHSHYFKYVKAKNFGDDNILCVSNQVPWFNYEALVDIFKTMGMSYNLPDKGQTGYDRITFLKRAFRYDSMTNAYMPALNMNSINEMVNWITEGSNPWEATLSNIEVATREMFHHGKEHYEEFTRKLQLVLQARGKKWFPEEWECKFHTWNTQGFAPDFSMLP
nr:MAG: RNA-dependent RNA polymerase [Riboviria sp.]